MPLTVFMTFTVLFRIAPWWSSYTYQKGLHWTNRKAQIVKFVTFFSYVLSLQKKLTCTEIHRCLLGFFIYFFPLHPLRSTWDQSVSYLSIAIDVTCTPDLNNVLQFHFLSDDLHHISYAFTPTQTNNNKKIAKEKSVDVRFRLNFTEHFSWTPNCSTF